MVTAIAGVWLASSSVRFETGMTVLARIAEWGAEFKNLPLQAVFLRSNGALRVPTDAWFGGRRWLAWANASNRF